MKSRFFTASLLASALFAGVAAAPAMAQNTYTPGIDNAQANVSGRIQQGLQTGRITPSEAQVLYRRQGDIEARQARFASDGNVSPPERQKLRDELQALNVEIDRMNANVVTVSRPANAVDSAEFNIHARIDDGVRSGRLSPQDAARLHERENAIERREAAYRADGVMTKKERRMLRNELTLLSEEVQRLVNPRG